MANYIITPNMNLLEPTVGLEAGPQYASDINASLTLIDQHDHSTGKGVQITPAGININAPLPFNDEPATGLEYSSYVAQASATSVVQALSIAPVSSINELWYTDSNGTQTQITSNGQVNVVASSIPGESYAAGTFIWTQTQSSLPTRPANFDIGSVTIRPTVDGTTNGVTLSPPSAISSQYSINLPALPGVTSFLSISAAGVMATPIATTGTSNQTITTVGGVPTWSSFNSNPMTDIGQMIAGGASGAPVAVAAGVVGQAIVSTGAGTPSFQGGIAAHVFSGTQITVPSPPNVLVFPSVIFDTNSAYNTSTGHYVCPVAGIYRVSIAGITNGASGELWYLYKNGAQSGTGIAQNPGANVYTGGTTLVQCAVGDSLTIVGVTAGVPAAPFFPSATFELVR
jgi:C1q domain